jgi:hypothetical protein
MALEGANSLMKAAGTKPLYRELATTMSRLAIDRQDGQRQSNQIMCDRGRSMRASRFIPC